MRHSPDPLNMGWIIKSLKIIVILYKNCQHFFKKKLTIYSKTENFLYIWIYFSNISNKELKKNICWRIMS